MESTPATAVNQDERTMGTLAHALQLVGAWIAPLIIFIMKRDSKFVAFHSLQVLFLQGAYMLFWVLFMIVWFAMMIVSSTAPHAAGDLRPFFPFVMMISMWGLAMLCGVGLLILGIVYAIKASRGEWAKYPVFGNLAARVLKIQIPG